jgi:soluble lytic murein transglycosylase-like protein
MLALANASFAQTSPDTRPEDLASVRRFLSSSKQRLSGDEGERAAVQADLAELVDAVVGEPAAKGQTPRLRSGQATRDADAYRLLALGYSAHETADIVSGRISRRALDTARKMIAAGQDDDVAADYLDRQYKHVVALRTPPRDPVWRPRHEDSPIDLVIDTYSNIYHVSAALVRAMIMTESGFDPGARSPKGAIGLMQLMPATARELGVNPRVPEQNIAGGVRYISELLRMFGQTELALIAYNAGPGYARRYARREAALYGETRDYVKKVLARAAAMH